MTNVLFYIWQENIAESAENQFKNLRSDRLIFSGMLICRPLHNIIVL